MFNKYIRKIVKPAKKAKLVIAALEGLGIDSLEKLDNLPQHGTHIVGYSTYLLVYQVREAYLLSQLTHEEEE
jgi:hypothetical protein